MATSFEALKLTRPGLFGVRLSGSVGRAEKNRLKEFAAKCLANGKLLVVFDLADLDAIGGGGASVLAEFQRELLPRGGEAVFVAPNDTVQRFLALQFGSLPFRSFGTVEEASAALAEARPDAGAASPEAPDAAGARTPAGAAGAVPAGAPPAAGAPAPGASAPAKKTPAAAGGPHEPAGAVANPADTDDFAFDAASSGAPDSALDDLLGGFAAGEAGGAARPRPGGAPRDPSLVPEARDAAGSSGEPPPLAPDASPDASPEASPDASPEGSDHRGRTAIPSASPASAGGSGAVRPQYISFENALVVLRNVVDVAGMVEPLRNLLHSFDLAREVTVYLRQGERFVADGGPGDLAAGGPLVAALTAAARPLSLLDMGDLELADAEARLLAELRADMALPVRRRGVLQAVAFIRRGSEGQEYGVSETFAVTLLGHLLSELADRSAGAAVNGASGAAAGERAASEGGGTGGAPRAAGGGEPAGAGDLPAELRRKILQMQVLFSISEDFSRVRDTARLMDLLCVTVTSQLGVRAVAILELEGEQLTPRIGRGLELERIPRLCPVTAQVQAWLAEQPLPAPVAELPPLLHRFQEVLAKAGFAYVAPLKTRGQLLGLVLLGAALNGTRPELDLDFLSTLLNQAAIAMDNARMLQQSQDQNIGVIRTLVSLIEQRSLAEGNLTERIAHLVGEVARELEFPPEKLRELTYGTVLRDIGMIPISDLVLRSPRKLTEAEWRQIKAHPEVGVQLLTPLQLPALVRDVVLNHHERFNGEGYPRGLQGRAIPLGARIVSVVESFVAMISDLPYRTALSPAEAIAILNENWGLRYDPEIVEAFLRVLAREEQPVPAEPGLAGAGLPGGAP